MCPVINANAGAIYYLALNNASATSSGFEIHFTGSASLDCDLITAVDDVKTPFINGNFSFSPNPASDIVMFNMNKSINDKITLTIYNILGELIYVEQILQNQQQINVKNLCNGIYIIEVKSGNWSEKRRLAIQR